MFVYTTAIDKIRSLTARKKVIQGGKDAGKTFGIIPILIDKAAREPLSEISIVSDSIPNLRRGAMKDFVKIMQLTGRWRPDAWNKTLLAYSFANGSYVEFFSAEDETKVRGPRRTDLYINEANRLTFDVYHQLATRTSGSIYIDFNPAVKFWAHTEVLHEPDADMLVLTYRDNEALSQHVLDDFDIAREKAANGSKYWQNWCRVYIDGEVGILEGSVFEDWQVIDEIPKEAELLGYGMDFGFRPAPAAVVAVYRMNQSFYFDEIVYQTGLNNQALASELKSKPIDLGAIIYADSAEPKSIDELQQEGLNIHPCGSKQDIRNYAIKKIQGSTFYVTKRSANLISELHSYIWDKDAAGNPTGKPKKGHDHGIDGLIYFVGSEGEYSGKYW